jgi:hypothetical protein
VVAVSVCAIALELLPELRDAVPALGNGSLGVAEWAANGFTAQLNRSDTMPNRLSPGQLNIGGLTAT